MPWLILPKDDPRFFKISKRFQVKSKPRLILMTPEGVVVDSNAEKAYYSGEGNILIESLLIEKAEE